jgi:hypothetical protein
MSQIPYNPMHALRKPVSEQRMHEILEKHKPKVEVVPTEPECSPTADGGNTSVAAGAASAENTLPALVWQKVNDWLMRTQCGRYRCRKYVPGESIDVDARPPKYQLEMLVADSWFYRCGPPLDSFKEARAAAQRHLEAQK